MYCIKGEAVAGRPEMVTAGKAAGDAVIWKLFRTEAGGWPLSVTVTTKESEPAAAMFPLINPAVLIVRPAGRPVADQVYGGVPPLAAI